MNAWDKRLTPGNRERLGRAAPALEVALAKLQGATEEWKEACAELVDALKNDTCPITAAHIKRWIEGRLDEEKRDKSIAGAQLQLELDEIIPDAPSVNATVVITDGLSKAMGEMRAG